MKLTDLAPLEKWIAFERHIYDKSGLSVNVFDAAGVQISDFNACPNELCPAIKGTEKGQTSICAEAHMDLAERARKKGRTVMDECDAGIMKLVVPVIVENQFIGAVGACGMLLDNGEVDDFLVAKITEIDEEEVISLAYGINSISSEDAFAVSREIETRISDIIADYLNGNRAR